MASANAELHQLDKSLIWSGFKQLAPISLFVTVFGAAFGLAAVQAGLDSTITVAMSTLVFAGAAQFAALDLWGPHIPLFTMMITVFAINANWAMSMQAFSRGKPGLGLLFGGGLALWIFWVFGTWIGTYFGNAIRDPKGLGLDMVMGCFLLAMVVGGDKSMRMLFIWVVAGLSSLLAYWYLPENSHVVVGALAGGIAGTVIGDTKQ
jgi:predicted branched-subunit amino acid permease